MGIGSAMDRGTSVYVYNERGSVIFTKEGRLVGYTGSTVTVQRGSAQYTYDDRGSVKYTK